MKTLSTFWAKCLLALGLFSSLSLRGQSVLEVRFFPSFIPKSTLILKQNPRGKNTLQLIYENPKDRVQTTEVKLPAKALDSLNSFLRTFVFRRKGSVDTMYRTRQLRPQDSIWIKPMLRRGEAVLIGKDSVRYRTIRVGHDGMSVEGSYEANNTKKTFKNWSPGRGSAEHQLNRLLYEMMITHVKEPSAVKYIEDLHGYLGLGLGIRQVSQKPLVWKCFGTLSYNIESSGPLIFFFEELPSVGPCYLDLSNFHGIAGKNHRLFKLLIDEYPQVFLYRPSTSVLKDLQAMKIQPERIVNRIPSVR
jgi:hypothetical protein